jgi:peptidyl-prolyl cis-trans isomerase SurA
MKKTAFLALLLLVVPPLTAEVNRIVLRVNDHIATLYDYKQRYSARLRGVEAADLSETERAEALATLGESVFRDMFDELLLLSRASHLRVEVTEAMVDDAVQRMREANRLNDQEAFESALAQAGMTRTDLREQARRNLLLQQVTSRELQSRVELEEEDLRRYYQSHLEDFAVPRRLDLRSIVVLDSSGLDEGGRAALAAEAVSVLEAGIDQETWAEAHSKAGETTTLLDLGWVTTGDLAPEIEAAVWPLETGAVSTPIVGRGGDHVVQVVAVDEAHVRPFSEVKEQVRRLEMSRLEEEAVTKMLNDFEKASFVRIDPPPEAAGFRTSRGLPESGLGAIGEEPEDLSTNEPASTDGGR